MGTHVVAAGAGSPKTAELHRIGGDSLTGKVVANGELGIVGEGQGDVYQTTFTQTESLGDRSGALASTNVGSPLGASGFNGLIFVPRGYVSGTVAFASSIFLGRTIQSLGLRSRSVVFRSGTGANADSINFQIGPSTNLPAVTEPSTWASYCSDLAFWALACVNGLTRGRALNKADPLL